MKLIFQLSSITFYFLFLALEIHSISNYEIIKICRAQRRENACIKRLKLNRELIYKGNPIEIPVYPFKPK